MKTIRYALLLSLAFFTVIPIHSAYGAKGTITLVDTLADPQSQHTAKYESGIGHHCTALLISPNVAVTAKHCGGTHPTKYGGTIFPGESGLSTPFGYMDISSYLPYPDPKYDVALLKGTERDKSRAYKYYIKKFTTAVTGLTDDQLQSFVGEEAYAYGYPYKRSLYKQYRSDGQITFYQKNAVLLRTTLPATEGQSGSGVFLKKDNQWVGIIITKTSDQANVLPINEEIAQWIKDNM